MLDNHGVFSYDALMHELLALAACTVRDAGAEALRYYGTVGASFKSDATPVTDADLAANAIVLRALEVTGIPVLSEESLGIHSPYPHQLWVVDPLDGTKDFIKGTNDFSVMVALLTEGRPVLGAVFVPARQKLYTAARGGGAYLDAGSGPVKLSVSGRLLPSLRFVKSRNNVQPYMDRVADALGVTNVKQAGSVGVKVGIIAEGEGDFYLTRGNLGEWDVCAPEVIALEAGGVVTDTNGMPLHYGNDGYRIKNGIVVSNGTCHDAIIATLKSDAGSLGEITR